MTDADWKVRRSEILRLSERGQCDEAVANLEMVVTQEESPRVFALGATVADRLSGAKELTSVRMKVLRSFTVEPVVAPLRAYGLLHKLALTIDVADYDQFEQVILADDDDEHPDAVLLAVRLEDLAPRLAHGFAACSPDEVGQLRDHVVERVRGWLGGLRRRYPRARLFYSGFVLPCHPAYGLADPMVELGHRSTIADLNRLLAAACLEVSDAFFVDIDQVLSEIGYRHACDPRMDAHARQPLSAEGIAAVGRRLARTLAAAFTKRRKCIVLDCDNTLWGGIVGEDGPEGIALGPDYPGLAYARFQEAILNLHKRGVVLAIASKNNENDVFEVLDNHPHAVLRRNHFAAWRIDWRDKVTSLRDLAAEINIGLDSLIFLDDSDFECAMVKERLPEVETIQLPTNPLELLPVVHELKNLDSLRISDVDRARGEMYRAQAKRSRAQKGSESLESFLESLELKLVVEEVSKPSIERAAQLSQRTNQFNLTTRRYSAADIEGFVSSADHSLFQVRLSDRFGDYGICGLVIAKRSGSTIELDTFLLSCRVIGRGIEEALEAFIENWAAESGSTELRGVYVPTRKNVLVADLYDRLGFERTDEAEGTVRYRRLIGQGKLRDYPGWFTLKLP